MNKYYIVIYNNTEIKFVCYCLDGEEIYHDESINININELLLSLFPLFMSSNNNVYDMTAIPTSKMLELLDLNKNNHNRRVRVKKLNREIEI